MIYLFFGFLIFKKYIIKSVKKWKELAFKKIHIKIKNLDEMEFEILENAQPGDFISLKEILDAGSKEITRYISKASNVISRAKEEEIYNKAKEHFSKNVIESKEYNDLIIKFESEKNELLREYQSSLKEELEKNRKSLSAKFTTDLDEALKKEKELIAFQKNIEFLELQNKIKSQSNYFLVKKMNLMIRFLY